MQAQVEPPPEPAARYPSVTLGSILATGACESAYPRWLGVEDRRDLGDPAAHYAVHLRALATARAAGPLRVALARLSDYAQERLGISARELQELGRVGAKLDDLPGLERALVSGSLGFSKVRLLVRVATAGDEARWIEQARQRSVSALADEVRAETGRESPDPDDTPRAFCEVACSGRVRGQWHRVREVAARVAGQPVSAGECIEMVTAEVRSALPPDPGRGGRGRAPGSGRGARGTGAAAPRRCTGSGARGRAVRRRARGPSGAARALAARARPRTRARDGEPARPPSALRSAPGAAGRGPARCAAGRRRGP